MSAPSVEDMPIEEVRELIQGLIDDTGLPTSMYNKDETIIHINPTGRYVSHSPLHDSGLTGRKLIVDSFGGYSPIGGGAQSSKDYTKLTEVDYMLHVGLQKYCCSRTCKVK